ncbi:MAG TPA: hypothetical protein VFV87_19440 [Pirellulaceae bacterium]|nr:hypothetical protein [Pirellulaceae bacterium]
MITWEEAIAHPRFWLSAGTLLSVAAALCLLINWAAEGQRVRLARVLLAWTAIMALVPIRAYVPALVFAWVAAMTFLLVRMIQFLSRERAAGESRWTGWQRYSLTDLMVLTLFAGTLIGLAMRLPDSPLALLGSAIVASCLAFLASLSYQVALSKRRAFLLVLLAATLVALAAPGRILWSLPLSRDFADNKYEGYKLFLHEVFLSLLILLSYFAFILSRATWKEWPVPRRLVRIGWIGFIASTTLFGLFIWYLQGAMSWQLEDEWRRIVLTLASTMPLLALAAIIMGIAVLAHWYVKLSPGTARRAATTSLSVGALAVALPLGWLYWQMFYLTPLVPFAPQSPTNYERLTEIADELRVETDIGRANLDSSRTKILVTEASELLKVPNHIPLSAVRRQIDEKVAVTDLRQTIAIEEAFAASAAELAEAGQHGRAADRLLDLMRFGKMLQRGGTSTHSAQGEHVQERVLKDLRDLSPQLSPSESLATIRALGKAILMPEDAQALDAREHAVNERVYDWHTHWVGTVYRVFPPERRLVPASRDTANLMMAGELAIRGAQLGLAHDQFCNVTGRPAVAISELVPEYLPALPLDPFTRQPLRTCRTADEDLVIYSVGPDGIDNGGNFARYAHQPYEKPGYDIRVTFD